MKTIRILALVFFSLLSFIGISPACTNDNIQLPEKYQIQTGDLLFVVTKGNSSLAESIKKSTSIDSEIPYTHVGIVSIENDSVFIIEATTPKVIKSTFEEFVSRVQLYKSNPLMITGRLKQPYRHLIPQGIENAKKQLGKPYDYAYTENNDAYYCSELVRFSFLDSDGTPIFPALKMSFKNKKTGKIDDYWIKHFERLGVPIPEGEPGTNPADMAKSDIIDIVYHYFNY